MLGQGEQQYGAIIGNDENSRFMGFGLLGLWVFDIYIYIYIYLLVFLVLLHMGFLVFDFFFVQFFFLRSETLSMKLLGF